MQTTYLNYSEDLLQKAITGEPKVYVFPDYSNKLKAKEYYHKPFLARESLFLTREELKEKLFVTDKLVLKEEKLVLMFYEILDQKDKEQLETEGYHDVIDLANNFLRFYTRLNEYNIEEIEDLNDWQREKYEIFTSLREKYIARMEELGYTDRTLSCDFANFTLQFLNDYEEVVLVNILDFTPREQEILDRLEAAGKQVKLYNQMAEQDFNEEELQLKSVTLPAELNTEIEIYQTSEELLEIVNFLICLEEDERDYTVLDADFKNSNYDNLLSSARVRIDKKSKFTATKLYRLLAGLYQLLVGSVFQGGQLQLRLADLLEISYQEEFRKYYGLTTTDLRYLNRRAKDGYVYFSRELDAEYPAQFASILQEVEKISNFTTLAEFCEFLQQLELELLDDERFSNNFDQFFDALAEIEAITELELVSSWRDYFNDRAPGLFLLVLKYLRFKRVKQIDFNNRDRVEIKDLLSSSFASRDNLILFNVIEGVLPTAQKTGFLLTEKQRSNLGLKIFQDRRREEKYKFFRHVASANRAIIFTIQNQERNIAPSSFVEELKLKYDLPVQEAEISGENYGQVIDNIFDYNSNPVETREQELFEQELEISAGDFENGTLSMTYYKYKTLQECYCKFYLRHLIGLEAEKAEVEKKISLRTLGIVVHEIFETVIERIKSKISQRKFTVDKGLIAEVVDNKIKENPLKIPKYYATYYHDVMFAVVKEAGEDFLWGLQARIDGEVIEVLNEWFPKQRSTNPFLSNQQVDVYLNGRIDLGIRTEEKDYLIDYKTGSGSQKQLDFYSLLFTPDLEAGRIVDKSIYDVLSQRFKSDRNDSHAEFKEELVADLTEFMESAEYRKEVSSRCNKCEYLDICRAVVK